MVRCNDATATFLGHSTHGLVIGQNAYPHLLLKFADGDLMFLQNRIPHLVNELVVSAC